jgi:hypothetical protein
MVQLKIDVIEKAEDPKDTPYPTSRIVFIDDNRLRNVSNRTCSYYTANARDTDALLSNINYSNVLNNINFGLMILNYYKQVLTVDSSWITRESIQPALSKYIEDMNAQMLQLGFIANCVTEALGATEQVFTAEKELETSKDRYEELHSPETHVSYYEGTFPIHRPIKDSTLFGLFAAGLFLMLLSLICFLRTQGVEINLILPQTTLPGISVNMFAGMGTYIGIASVLGIITGYFIHIYYKQ